jgi:hypothetical protein
MAATRNLMAPNTDPTDEELDHVMVAARDEARRKRALAQAKVDREMHEAVAPAAARIPRHHAARRAS